MDIGQIRAFCQLAQDGNYRIASEHLFMTQSALTKKIQKLEENMGACLFERGRLGAELTQVGKALLPEAAKILVQFRDFKSISNAIVEGTQGHLNIGFGVSSYHQAPKHIAEFKRRFPDVRLTLNDTPSKYQAEALVSGELQLSFNRLPVKRPLEGKKLASDCLVIAVHTDIPVNSAELWPSLSSLDYLRLTPHRGPKLHQQITAFLHSIEQTLSAEQEADDILTLLALVSARLGYTIVPASAKAIAPPNINFIPLTGPHTRWDVGIIWNTEKTDPLREQFVQLTISSVTA